jgi:hypothetical protein
MDNRPLLRQQPDYSFISPDFHEYRDGGEAEREEDNRIKDLRQIEIDLLR